MAADTVPGARGSLARTAAILQSALRAPGPMPGAVGDGGTREASLSCPTEAGQGETRAQESGTVCPRDTGNRGHCSAMATEQVPSAPQAVHLDSSESQPVSIY